MSSLIITSPPRFYLPLRPGSVVDKGRGFELGQFFEMLASPSRMLLRASVTSISRPVRPSRLPQALARAYSQNSPLSDTPPPPPRPPHTVPTPPPTPPASLPSVATLDFGTDEPAARMRTGAKSAKDSLSSIERRRRNVGWVSSGLLVTGLVGGYIYLGREPDEKIDVRSLSWFTHPRSLSLMQIRTARS